MVSYEKSVAMKEKAVKDYLDKKINDSEFIMRLRKAGFGEIKAKQILDKTIVASLTYRGKAEKKAEAKAASEASKQAKAEEKAAKAADDAERTAKADAIKKANGDVPSVEEVMIRPLKGKPVLGEKGPHKPATHDKKAIETVDNVIANYDPEKAMLGKIVKPKSTRAKAKTTSTSPKTSSTKAKHDAMRAERAAEIDKQAGLSSIYTEEYLTEGIKFFKGSKALNHYLKIYYKKTPKLKIKIEKLGEDKAKKASELLKDIDKNIASIKVMKDDLAKLENKFSSIKTKEEKEKLKAEYKDVYRRNKPLIKTVVRQTDKLNHTYFKTALAGAGIYYLIEVARGINQTMKDLSEAFDEYMDGLKLDKFDMGPALNASIMTEESNSNNKEIAKIDKAINKAKRTAESKKAEKNPKVKEGANKVIRELEAKKKKLINLQNEKDKAEKDVREAKTDEAKKKAELRALKADRAYKKFLKVEKPVMMVCKIITTLTSVTALVTFFVMASKISGSDNLFSRLSKYVSSGGSSSRFNRETESALRGLGKAIGDGFSYGNRYHSVVTEDTNYFPY